jgi:predicted heme/steroid binding protein
MEESVYRVKNGKIYIKKDKNSEIIDMNTSFEWHKKDGKVFIELDDRHMDLYDCDQKSFQIYIKYILECIRTRISLNKQNELMAKKGICDRIPHCGFSEDKD